MTSYSYGRLQNNNYNKEMVYLVALNIWQSWHDFAYGYYEAGQTGYLTFIQPLR